MAAARQDHAQAAVERAAAPLLEQRRDLALQLAPRHLVEPKVRRRTFEPVEVVTESERPPVVHPDDLEHAVPAQEALVRGGDGGLPAGMTRPSTQASSAIEVGREGIEPSTLRLRVSCSAN